VFRVACQKTLAILCDAHEAMLASNGPRLALEGYLSMGEFLFTRPGIDKNVCMVLFTLCWR